MTIFATLTPIDPGTNTRVTVRLCASQDEASTGAAGEIWWPAISALPVIQLRFFDGDFSSAVDAPTSAMDVRLDVLIASGQFPRVEQYDWADADCRLQRLSGGSLVDVQLMQVDSFASEDLVLGLRLRAAQELFNADVLRATYAGTTGAEGGADLKGQLKPWIFGRALNVEPVFIDQIDNVFQVSGYGAVQAISAVYERGASFGASIGDFASYAALVAANIPEGRWGTCLAQGMFRLGAPPAGVITCDVDGDNVGGFLRRTGAILSQIATRIGLVDKVNAASMSALDTAVPRNVNIVIREQTSFMELAQRMLAPCNAVGSVGGSGRLIASRVAFGSEQFTLDAQGREMPPVLGMARQNTSPPYKRVQMGAARSWRVHTFDEIAFFAELIDRGIYSGTEVYREGNIVELADKSRWVYVNPTASSGNAPPTWPTTSNSFWSNIAPPLAPAAIGLEAGATRNVARGTYDAGTTYTRGDEVIFSGSSYRLIVDTSTGNAPPDVARWALLANAGSGPAGADGLPGISVLVSNEAHVVATATDGSGGDYSAAGGTMRLLRGDTVLTPTFSIAAQTPASPSWISINASTGVYTVTDPGVDLATATLRATWAGVNYDRTYTLAKSKQGATGPRLALAASAQAFTFTDGAANPGGQSITIEALLNNLTGTASFSTTPTVTLTGTGNTRTLTAANFGTNRQVTIEATLGGITDRITIVRLDRDAFGGNANRVPFSRMEGDRGWGVLFNPAGLSVTTDYGIFQGLRFFRAAATATGGGGGQQLTIGSLVPNHIFRVTPGERLSIQARVETLGAGAGTYILEFQPLDESLNVLDFHQVASGGIRSIVEPHVAGFYTVPAGAVWARFELRAIPSGAGYFQVVISEPMVTSAAAGQTAHPPFTPGPNAVDGALPNDLITIGGDGLISGIGTGGINVDNRRAALQGLASARPASGQFIGQEYHATDTREISQWDGFNWRTSADITATAQRSIEPQFPVIEIKQGEAGHTGNRTVTHTAKRGTATLTGGTWSLVTFGWGVGGAASINASTGVLTISGVIESGAYAVRYTHTDGLQTDKAVNVTYIPTPPGGVVSAKTASTSSNTGVGNTNDWSQVIALTITGAPAGRLFFNQFGLTGGCRITPNAGTGTATHEARVLINGTAVRTLAEQTTVSGGIIGFVDFTGLFDDAYAVAAGTVTVAVQLRRTSGTGTITSMTNRLDVNIIAS